MVAWSRIEDANNWGGERIQQKAMVKENAFTWSKLYLIQLQTSDNIAVVGSREIDSRFKSIQFFQEHIFKVTFRGVVPGQIRGNFERIAQGKEITPLLKFSKVQIYK